MLPVSGITVGVSVTVVTYFLNVHILLSIVAGVAAYFALNAWNERQPPLKSSYDYIIVGAGSAGCVVAARLSEDPNVSVLLVEAGGSDDTFLVNTPLSSPLLQRGELDWQYKTVPQTNSCMAHANGQSNWPRGKVLGGCSSINYMAYVRGNKADYDLWEKLGCKGWSYRDVLPYFMRSESNTRFRDSKYHGTDGPMGVSDLKEVNQHSRLFVDACDEVGIKKIDDYNGESQFGAGLCQVTQEGGVRANTSRAFLRPARGRANLRILTKAHVTGIVFNAQKEAIGIRYVVGKKGSAEQMIQANKEVILSAGAVGSPQLLLLSGVGPKQQLEQLGIPVVADLPGVGENMQDHLMTGLGYYSKLPSYTESSVGTLPNLINYLLYKDGPFQSNGLECTAFVNTGLRDDLLGAPDIQIHCFASVGNVKDFKNLNFRTEFMLEDMVKGKTINGMTFLPILLHPKSKGA